MFGHPLRKVAHDKNIAHYIGNPDYGYKDLRALLGSLGYAK